LWSFNWLPLGGFVRMVGEESSSAVGSLGSKPRWQRIVVMGAGAFVNLVIPFVLLPLVLMIPAEKPVGDVTIVTVFPGSPADEAGIQPGDKIVKVDGRTIDNISELQQAVTVKLGAESTWELQSGVPNIFARPAEAQYQYTGDIEKVTLIPRWKPPYREVVAQVSDPETEMALSRARVFDVSVGLNTLLTVVDEPSDTLYEISNEDAAKLDPPAALGDILQVVAVAEDAGKQISLSDARLHDNALGIKTTVQEGATGVQISTENSQIVNKGLSPIEAFPLGWRHALDTVVLTRNALTTTIIGSSNPQFEGPSTVGPIGIGQLTGEIAVADAGLGAKIITFATLAATLSLSLAILNILPIPALDGGRIFFVFVEIARRGKRISPEKEGLVHLVGFALLIGLIAVISVQDVTRIIRGESFF
jgi:regulator of sigma E protease